MSDGIGCMCAASNASDCCCDDVDWTPQIVYDLQQKLAEREKQIMMLHGDICRAVEIANVAPELVQHSTGREIRNILREALDSTQDLFGLVVCDAEPVAWSTFDGEGGYDYRSYIDNEDYRDKYRKLNSSSTYFNWVEPLYKARKP
jgi:hypothetical protein